VFSFDKNIGLWQVCELGMLLMRFFLIFAHSLFQKELKKQYDCSVFCVWSLIGSATSRR